MKKKPKGRKIKRKKPILGASWITKMSYYDDKKNSHKEVGFLYDERQLDPKIANGVRRGAVWRGREGERADRVGSNNGVK